MSKYMMMHHIIFPQPVNIWHILSLLLISRYFSVKKPRLLYSNYVVNITITNNPKIEPYNLTYFISFISTTGALED